MNHIIPPDQMMKKSLFLSDRVYKIDSATESNARGLALGVAGVSFAALLAIAAMTPSDALFWSACCFASALPLALFQSFLSGFVSQGGWSTRGSRLLVFGTGHISHLALASGAAFVLFHISIIVSAIAVVLGGLLWITAVLYARKYSNTCAALDERDHEGMETIQPPLK